MKNTCKQLTTDNCIKCSRDGAVVRALAFHQCGPGSIPARCHVWVKFVVGSFPCSEGFSPGSPVFLSLQKNKKTLQIPIRPPARKPARADVASSLNIVVHILFYFIF